MKNFHNTFPFPMTTLRAVGLLLPCLFAAHAQATTATANFTVSLPVNSPSCTVTNDNATVLLPTATSPNQTGAAYLSANGITTASIFGAGVTSPTLNHSATITCTTASTPITSFVVAPATGASIAPPGGAAAFLVDTAATPNKAANSIQLWYEQVSVTNPAGTAVAAPWSYISGANAVTPYSTSFTTTAIANGTATVVWRPVLYVPFGVNVMGTPTGGAFISPGLITVNY